LTDFLGGGAKYEEKNVCAKTQKVTIFSIQGGKYHPPGPPQMTSLVAGSAAVSDQQKEVD